MRPHCLLAVRRARSTNGTEARTKTPTWESSGNAPRGKSKKKEKYAPNAKFFYISGESSTSQVMVEGALVLGVTGNEKIFLERKKQLSLSALSREEIAGADRRGAALDRYASLVAKRVKRWEWSKLAGGEGSDRPQLEKDLTRQRCVKKRDGGSETGKEVINDDRFLHNVCAKSTTISEKRVWL